MDETMAEDKIDLATRKTKLYNIMKFFIAFKNSYCSWDCLLLNKCPLGKRERGVNND